MGKIDRREAPKGYVAKRYKGKKGYTCDDCAFNKPTRQCELPNWYTVCGSEHRKDGQTVIFVKKPNAK